MSSAASPNRTGLAAAQVRNDDVNGEVFGIAA